MERGVPISASTRVYEAMESPAVFAKLEPRKRALTLEHLLTMSSGLDIDDSDSRSAGNEDSMQQQYGQPDWCRYTLDLCLEQGRRRPWPLYVDGRAYALRPNEGLLYLGCDQTHYRRGKPPGPVHVALFHFVDSDFEGDLD